MAFGSVEVLLYYQEETTPPPSPLQLEPWIGFVDIVGHYNVKPGATAGSIIVTPGIPNTDLIDRVHAKQKKIVLVVGGGGMSGGITTDAAFRRICGTGSDPAKRAQFVDLVLDEVVKGYDGIDLD